MTDASGGKPRRLTVSDLLTSPVHFLAYGAGSGLAPKAPGTVGTLAAIPLLWLLPNNPLAQLLLIVVLFAGGVYLCDQAARTLQVHDHPGIVFDEWVGFFLTMVAVPRTALWIVLGFVLFRVFDVLKPWPISWLDKRVHGGFGIMVDDLLAGVFAAVCLQLLLMAFA